MKPTQTLKKLLSCVKSNRITIMQGGTSSGKTWAALGLIHMKARASLKPRIFSVVANTLPALKKGAIRDFIDILGPEYNEQMHNKTDNSFQIGNCTVEFFSLDDARKAKGPRRDWIFINEANLINKDTYDQLAVRTKEKIIIDFNPDRYFWAHDLIGQPGVGFFKSTYKENNYLQPEIIKEIESRRGDSNWWRVYGQGEIGKIEGLIFHDFDIVRSLPDGIDTDGGLDFGFTNDPSAFIESGINGGELYFNELFYERGLTNDRIAGKFKALGVPTDYYIYADSAEPKSIQEIREKGFLVKPCFKGPDSIRIGIDYIKRYKIKVTADSENWIKEARTWSWKQNPNSSNQYDKYLNVPEDYFNHAMDASRYANSGRIQSPMEIIGVKGGKYAKSRRQTRQF